MASVNGIPFASTNNLPQSYPIAYDDGIGGGISFQNGGLRSVVEVPPTNFTYLGLKFYDEFYGGDLMKLDPLSYDIFFGGVTLDPVTYDIRATAGFGCNPAWGEFTMGCGISNPSYGIFRASGNFGYVTLGTSPSTSIGITTNPNTSVRIGSQFMGFYPSDPTNPLTYIQVTDENQNLLYIPVYR